MAIATGCQLDGSNTVAGELVGTWTCPDVDEGDPLATARLLQALTDQDASLDELEPGIVAAVRGGGAPPPAHAYVKSHVIFREEDPETFQTPSATFRLGAGDCDDSARALVS